MRGKWILALVALATSLFGMAAVNLTGADTPAGAAKIAPVEGATTPSLTIRVATSVGGIISDVLVEEGQTVEKDQPILKFDDTIVRARLAVAQAQADSTAEFDVAQSKINRVALDLQLKQELVDRGVSMALTDIDKLQLDLKRVEAELKVAQVNKLLAGLQRDLEQARLDQLTLRAPRSGYITTVEKFPGEAAEALTPVLKMLVLDPLYIYVYLPESTRGVLAVGDEAVWTPEGKPGASYRCEVFLVDKVVDAASHKYRVGLRLPNPDGMIAAGLKGTVEFQTSSE